MQDLNDILADMLKHLDPYIIKYNLNVIVIVADGDSQTAASHTCCMKHRRALVDLYIKNNIDNTKPENKHEH